MNFPLKIKMGAAALQELHSCEYGSYEDHIHRDGSREGEYADGRLHIVEIIDRSPFKTRVEVRSQQELDEFISSALTGTFGLYCLGTCRRLFNQYHKHCTPERVQNIRYGSLGY